jgi:hypothetical protein
VEFGYSRIRDLNNGEENSIGIIALLVMAFR